jgi:hypothetical protein
MKTLTVAEIMALGPCEAYPESRVLELWQGKDSLTALEILSLDIPPEDRLWVLTRNGVLPDSTLRQFANMTADRAVRNHCLTCGVPVVEAWARNWIDGTNRTTYAARAAADAAYAADAAADAYAAAHAADAAADAAYAASYAADAAAHAVYAVAHAVAHAAADAASYAAERQLQIADLVLLLEVRHDDN